MILRFAKISILAAALAVNSSFFVANAHAMTAAECDCQGSEQITIEPNDVKCYVNHGTDIWVIQACYNAPITCYCPIGWTVSGMSPNQGCSNGVSYQGCSGSPIPSVTTVTSTVATTSTATSVTASCTCKSGYSQNANTCTNSGNTYTCGTEPVLAAAATSSTSNAINESGNNTSGNQNDTIESAANISDGAASNRGTIAAANCAQGANDELVAAGSGTEAVASCQDDFAKAKALAKMAAAGGKDGTIKADQGVLASEDVQGIFNKFEKNFGVSKEDYLSRMLNSRGSPDELKDMLSSKFSNDKFDKMMAAAGEIKPETMAQKESGVGEISADFKKKPADASLKEYLKKKLLVATSGRDLAAAKGDGSRGVRITKITNLKPAGLDQIMNGNQEQESELNLFEIVHLKLRDFTARQRL